MQWVGGCVHVLAILLCLFVFFFSVKVVWACPRPGDGAELPSWVGEADFRPEVEGVVR
jgi:hypothetical protein